MATNTKINTKTWTYNKSLQIMARETSMEHYNELRKLESEYESAKSQIKSYNSMEFDGFIITFIFIIPGVIYISYKTIQKILLINTKIAEIECKNYHDAKRLSSGGGIDEKER